MLCVGTRRSGLLIDGDCFAPAGRQVARNDETPNLPPAIARPALLPSGARRTGTSGQGGRSL